MPDNLTFDNPTSVTFEIDEEARTIKGLALPFGDVGDNGHGKFSFGPGALTWGKVKVLDGHDWSKAVGTAELAETPEGIHFTGRIAPGARGDEVLALAKAGVYDGLSVGLGADAKFATKDGVQHAQSGTVREVSVTPAPAFENAAIQSVTASAVQTPTPSKESTVTDVTPDVQPVAAELSNTPAVPAREVVPAAPEGVRNFQVSEAPLYRFDGRQNDYDFSTDLFAAIRFKDGEAKQRIEKFMADQAFAATATGDVSALNPATPRPDLYVDAYVKPTPVYNALYKGALSSITPFVVPKFSSSSGWVDDHTEGEEPTEGAFTATSQTVTPTAVSGLAKITREVVDAGGNPQVSGLIWNEMQRAYANALEAKAAAVLSGGTFTELGTAMATTDTLAAQEAKVSAAISAANFATTFDFDNYSVFLADANLWSIVTSVTDEQGRPLYPQVNAANANGSTGRRFATVDYNGFDLTPAKTLGAGKAYIFDPAFGGVWASGIQRISLPETVAVETQIGIFGYVGSAVLDTSKIRKVTTVATHA